MSEARILVVDDEYLIRWTLQQNLEKEGYEVILAETGEEALEKVKEEAPDLALLDIKLPGMDGYEVLEKALKIDEGIIPIMITAFDEVEKVVKAMRLGAFDYITKPFDFSKVHLSIQKALETSQLKREVRHLRKEKRNWFGFDHIVAVSQEMGRVLQISEKIAQSEAATVLIQGESGTGKEVIAHLIHERSKRQNMPFITVNCANFPEQMLENELCGHEKGAFTDAKEVKKGLLEVADGGTLFLDEIGDMGLNLQGKILRLVEQKSFRRIGGLKDIQVDVRIVTATNKDLLKLKEEGKFREDLFYRINVASIRLPLLRERPDDILPLTKYFLQKYNEEFHKNVQKISKGVEDFLRNYNWSGNVRELKNVIERAMILGDGDILLMEHLPIEILGQASKQGGVIEGIRIPPDGISLEKVEEALVRQALKMTNGNQTRAAKLLDISRDALRYRMQKFGMLDSRPD
ncbi:MAG: sigma-54 dependent transcriptional regulator [Desulfobacterales bacterium]|nr:sigma-54 dependent transcriptional regulator [Desulfobacterales bacterium]